MVSPQNPTDVTPGTVRSDRGFAQEEIAAAGAPYTGAVAGRYPYPVYFWGSVIAGSLFVLSMFVLSYALMLGCHVGVVNGALSLGWGSAIWIVITSCIAFYVGGMITNSISQPLGAGWLKGAAIWGLSIPLALVIWAVVAGGSGLLLSSTTVNTQTMTTTGHVVVPFGFIWTAFTTLICGLIFAIFGSQSAAPVNIGTLPRSRVAT